MLTCLTPNTLAIVQMLEVTIGILILITGIFIGYKARGIR